MFKTKSKPSASWVEDQGSVAWVNSDARSVSAMLRGRGDFRVRAYEQFCSKALESNPKLSLEELSEKYDRHVRLEESKKPGFWIVRVFNAT